MLDDYLVRDVMYIVTLSKMPKKMCPTARLNAIPSTYRVQAWYKDTAMCITAAQGVSFSQMGSIDPKNGGRFGWYNVIAMTHDGPTIETSRVDQQQNQSASLQPDM